MYDTYVTIVGTVLNKPEKRTTKSNTPVTTFRVASHPRHFDKDTNSWVDSPGLRIKVNCWRRLAEHVEASVGTGDPVIVYGRQSTRDWKTPEGDNRTMYEVDAITVGHDLNRGIDAFTKIRPEAAGLVVEDSDRVNGEPTYGLSDRIPDEEVDDMEYSSAVDDDALAVLQAAGLRTPDGDEDLTDDEEVDAAGDLGGAGGRGRRRGRQPVPA